MSLWDICADLVSGNAKHVVSATKDYFVYHDQATGQTLQTQNLKKHSGNTAQVMQDRQKFTQADIIWVFAPNGGYSHRIDFRVDSEGTKTGELYQLEPRPQKTIGSFPDDPDITVKDLLQKK